MAKAQIPLRTKQHILKPVSSSYIPQNWLFLDTETKVHTIQGDTSHFFSLGWTCFYKRNRPLGKDSQEWIFHISTPGLNSYIERTALFCKNLHLIGHNIFFDLQAAGFYSYFTERGWKLNFYYDKGLTYILKCKKGKSFITVVSSTNWFDFSLARLGTALGYPKLSIDFDSATRDELKVYCKVDVEILVKALNQYFDFIQKHDLGKFSLTKASQAFTAYRHRFMSHKILIHSEDHILELERSAYMGGRCECFHLGNIRGGPFVTLDVNAMYPYVMREQKYPWKLLTYYENPSVELIAERLLKYAVIAEIHVDTCEPVFAVKVKGKTIFPTGKFDCFVTTKGFNYAFSKGYIIRVLRASVYFQTNLFSGYVNYFHDLRGLYKSQNNDMFLLLCKYMHNSLYGKFGQLKIVTDITDAPGFNQYSRDEVFNTVTGRIVTITRLMNQEIVQYPEGEGDNSNVAIAAHITENARFVLWNLIKKVGKSRVLYCDTDSVKIRSKDLFRVKNMINPNGLGKLKIEDTSDTLILEGAKNYRTEHKRKIKGIPKNAIEVKPGVFQYTSFWSQTLHLRSAQITGARVTNVTRTLKHTYSKGNVLKSGRVIPFRF